MKSPAPELYLTHILESIELARSYVAGIDFVEFSRNQQLQDAVVRRIEIIGEAASSSGAGLASDDRGFGTDPTSHPRRFSAQPTDAESATATLRMRRLVKKAGHAETRRRGGRAPNAGGAPWGYQSGRRVVLF